MHLSEEVRLLRAKLEAAGDQTNFKLQQVNNEKQRYRAQAKLIFSIFAGDFEINKAPAYPGTETSAVTAGTGAEKT